MNCPSCAAKFSELRDICPSCEQDLRPWKRQNGIAVSFPSASYDSLRRRLEKERGKSATDNPDHPDDPVEKELQKLLEREHARQDARAAGEGRIVEGSIVRPMLETSRIAPVALPHVETSPQPAPEEPEPEIVELTEAEVHEEAVHEESVHIEAAQAAAVEEEAAHEDEAPEAFADTGPRLSVEAREESEEMAALFSELEALLRNGGAERDLSLYQLEGFREKERVELLFNLSEDALLHPEKSFGFLNDPQIAVNSGLEMMNLQKAHESLVMKTPAMSLPPLRSKQRHMAARAGTPAPMRQALLRKKVALKNAPLGERFVAFALDLACITLLALILGVFLALASSTNADEFLTGLVGLQPLELITTARFAIYALGIFLVVYPFMALLTTGTTPGLAALGLHIETEDADAPTLIHALARSITFPLTFILIGPLPFFPGGRFFHDFAARVAVGRRD